MELIRCDKSMNAAEFLQILGKELISSIQKCFHDERVADIVFQHDNAPVHSTKVPKHYLQCNTIKTMFYLGKILEMNPIGNQAYVKVNLLFSNEIKSWKVMKLESENVVILRC